LTDSSSLADPAEPRLRFPDFEGEWPIQPLGRFVREFREVSKVHDQHEVLTSARSGIIRQRDYYESDRVTDKSNIGFNVLPVGHITYRSRSDDRRFFFNINDTGSAGIVSIYYPVFTILDGDDHFFVNLLHSKSRHIGRYSVGTSQTVLSLNELRKIKLRIPQLAEQQKIASFLNAVDSRIALFSRRRVALERYKKGISRRIFTQNVRFKRDDGTAFRGWVEKRLGDGAEFIKGRGISKDDIVVDGALPCIRYGELYTVYREKIDDVISATDAPAEELLLSKRGDVILPASGETPLDMSSASCVLSDGVALGGDLNVIRSDIDGLFLAYLLRSHARRDVARLAQGNSVVHLYGTHLARLRLTVPSDPDEQRKIAEFLTAVSDKIAALSAKIKAMQAFKKGLLQRMFV
jgi:type I restriction enzyme S subunit